MLGTVRWSGNVSLRRGKFELRFSCVEINPYLTHACTVEVAPVHPRKNTPPESTECKGPVVEEQV